MLFPDTDRVVYEKNPLTEVIVQVKFPSLLRVASELPADFQELVRDKFPILKQRSTGLPDGLERLIPAAMLPKTQVAYEFASENSEWTLSLSVDFLALSCRQYSRWEEFWIWLEQGLSALNDVYAPASYDRVGLRYQNVIYRTALGIADTPWSELLEPYVAGELASGIEGAISSVSRELLVQDRDRGIDVQMRHGFATHNETKETCYSIDTDLFTTRKTAHDRVETQLNELHAESGRAFRWCITESLHTALQPTKIELDESP